MVHIKCRHGFYPFSKTARISVGDDQVPWSVLWKDYNPPMYESNSLQNKPWADPSISKKFYNCRQYIGLYDYQK